MSKNVSRKRPQALCSSAGRPCACEGCPHLMDGLLTPLIWLSLKPAKFGRLKTGRTEPRARKGALKKHLRGSSTDKSPTNPADRLDTSNIKHRHRLPAQIRNIKSGTWSSSEPWAPTLVEITSCPLLLQRQRAPRIELRTHDCCHCSGSPTSFGTVGQQYKRSRPTAQLAWLRRANTQGPNYRCRRMLVIWKPW